MCGNGKKSGVCVNLRRSGAILATVAVASLFPSPGLRGQETTAEEVISRAIEAMGGEERIGSWETIRIQYNLPDHGGSSVTEIRRPNLFRARNLVFDGERAAYLPPPGAEGQGPEIVPAEEWKDLELDIAWTVPAFLDYPTEYVGTDSVLGHPTHMLEVSLPLGANITYYVDAETYMVLKAAADFSIRGNSHHSERLFTNHREVDGILFPWAFTYQGRQGEVLTASMEEIQVDTPLPEEHFQIQGSSGEGGTPGLTPIPFGYRMETISRNFQETREVLVWLPRSYLQEEGPDASRYPVLYVLEGQDYFEPYAGMVRYMTMYELIPEMIVVAVPHGDRMKELTFTPANEEYGDWPTSGGAETFLRFLEEELVPLIDGSFRTHPYRILAGHSLGGLFAIESMGHSPDLFQATLSLSPSLAWNQYEWLKASGTLFDGRSQWRHTLLISMEPREEELMQRLSDFEAMVETRAPEGFEYQFAYYPEESHVSVGAPGFFDNLRALYEGWLPEGEWWQLGPDAVLAHFQGLSQRFGYDIPIPEADLVGHAEHGAIRHDSPDEAFLLLELCLRLYPESIDARVGMGQAYEAKGDLAQAREWYQEALELDPDNEVVQTRLEAIRGGAMGIPG